MVRPAADFETTPGPTPSLGDLDALGEEIAEIAAHLNAVTYRLLERIAAFDALFQECGGATGFQSTAHWLAWRTGLSTGAAREKVRVAKALADLPELGAAMGRGALSYSKIRALTRVATRANESELLELAEHATAAELERLVRGWRRLDELERPDRSEGVATAGDAAEVVSAETPADLVRATERERHERRRLTLYPCEDGSWRIRGRLDPEVGAALEKALEAASEALYGRRARAGTNNETGPGYGTGLGEASPGEANSGEADLAETDPGADATATQRRADAVGLLAEAALRSDNLVPHLACGRGNTANQSATADDPRDAADAAGGTADAGDPANSIHLAGGVFAETPADPPSVSSRADRYQVVLHLERALWDPAPAEANAPLIGSVGQLGAPLPQTSSGRTRRRVRGRAGRRGGRERGGRDGRSACAVSSARWKVDRAGAAGTPPARASPGVAPGATPSDGPWGRHPAPAGRMDGGRSSRCGARPRRAP